MKPFLVVDLRDESVSHETFSIELLKAAVEFLWFCMSAVQKQLLPVINGDNVIPVEVCWLTQCSRDNRSAVLHFKPVPNLNPTIQ